MSPPPPRLVAPARFRIQGYDPLLIISQIISLQSLHYLTLTFLIPPLTALLANGRLLEYEGGSRNIALLMDWRSFSGRALVEGGGKVGALVALGNDLNSKGAAATIGLHEIKHGLKRVIEDDKLRGWIIALCWMLASLIDVVYLYYLIRRPTHVLDFSLTLLFSHILLTTYYSSTFPTSLFYWSVLVSSCIAQVVLAENWCVRREMREGFTVDPIAGGRGRPDEEIELGTVKAKRDREVSYERVAIDEER